MNKQTTSQEDWVRKLEAGKSFLQNYIEAAEKINEIHLPTKKNSKTKLKLNLFNSNVDVLKASMFARLPQPTVSRRFSDPRDQVGRVASNLLERALSFDINASTRFRNVAKAVLQDYLVGGSGWIYASYNAEVDKPLIPSSTEKDDLSEGSVVIKNQNCSIEFISYKDVLWSPARNWEEVSWWARRVWLDEEDFIERFGKEKAGDISFDAAPEDEENTDVIDGKVGIWEVWCKESRKVYFIAQCVEEILDEIEDPYGLPEFFPTTPFFANVNNDQFIPVSDFQLLEFQYRSLDDMNNRINRLSKSIRLAGVYNAEHGEVRQLLETPGDSVMVPLANWNSFAEKGGLAGAFSFMPIQEFAQVVGLLQQNKDVQSAQIEQISGISDVVRGAGGNPYESAAASKLKSQYASVRLGSKSDEFARILTYVVQCFGHFICKFYTSEQLLSRVGTIPEEDQQFVEAALQLLGNELTRHFMIEVSTDSIKAEDFGRDTTEKTMVMQQLTSYLPQAIQGAMQVPELAPIFFELLQWVVAGTRGAREIEGLIAQALQQYAIAQAEKQANPPEPKPDPAMEQIRAQVEMNTATQETKRYEIDQQAQVAQLKLQQEMQMAQMKMEQEFQLEQLKLQNEALRLQIEQQKLELERDKLETNSMLELEKIKQNDQQFLMQLGAEGEKNEVPPTEVVVAM